MIMTIRFLHYENEKTLERSNLFYRVTVIAISPHWSILVNKNRLLQNVARLDILEVLRRRGKSQRYSFTRINSYLYNRLKVRKRKCIIWFFVWNFNAHLVILSWNSFISTVSIYYISKYTNLGFGDTISSCFRTERFQGGMPLQMNVFGQNKEFVNKWLCV